MNYCRINEGYTGAYTAPTNNNFSAVGTMSLSGCRLEGLVLLPSSNATLYGAGNVSYNSTMQNVFDWDLRVMSDASSNSYTFQTGKGLLNKTIKSYSDPSVIYTPTISVTSGVITATQQEMTDPAALYAKGFDIVVP